MAQAVAGSSGSALPAEILVQLRKRLRGDVLTPTDPGYDHARRVFNGMVDRHPALIVQPFDTSDVQAAVTVARQYDVLVSVKGGGHSVAGHGVCDAGLVIDLCRLKTITVDPDTAVGTAEGGVTWGEFDAVTQAHGLAVTGGRIRTTGVGGLTLGSGSGWLERKLGFTVDNLVSAQVVLANGELVHTSYGHNTDLFWGLRGGGGNFGIVTKFEYRLHRVGPIVYGGLLGFPRDQAARVMRAYRDFMETAPDDVGGGVGLLTAPPAPFVPPEMQGRPIVAVIVCYTGAPEDGERAFQPLLALRPPLRMVQPMPYVALQGMLDEANPYGRRNYWKAHVYPELPDAAIDMLSAASAEPVSPFTSLLLQPMGGLAGRIPEDSSAMGWRRAKWSLHILGMWENAAEDSLNVEWVRRVAGALLPWAQEGAYLNYLMDEGESRVRESFGGHYGRMVALKNRYDPTNFFRCNQNIKPAA